MRRMHLILLLSVALLMATAVPALAGYDWCWGDPVLNIQGSTVNAEVLIPADRVQDLKGPIQVRVSVPAGVQATVVAVTGSSFTEEVKVDRSEGRWNGSGAVPVTVTARAKAKNGAEIPVQLRISGSGVVGGPLVDEKNGEAQVQFQVTPGQG